MSYSLQLGCRYPAKDLIREHLGSPCLGSLNYPPNQNRPKEGSIISRMPVCACRVGCAIAATGSISSANKEHFWQTDRDPHHPHSKMLGLVQCHCGRVVPKARTGCIACASKCHNLYSIF